MTQKYRNLPLKPDIYANVKLIAEANGFGERGLGKQVEEWTKRELPACEHPKEAVSVEIFPSQDKLSPSIVRQGWYCSTCRRVYQRIEPAAGVAEVDPYGQPRVLAPVKKRRISKAVTA